MAYIGAVLLESGVEVKVLNLADVRDPSLGLIPDADYFGVTCVSATLPFVKRLVPILKEKGTVILGGPPASVLPQKTYEDLKPDIVMMGEAEFLLEKLVTGKITPSPIMDAGYIKNLDILPFPARHLFSPEDVVDLTGIHGCAPGKPATTINSSRGCPYHCRFCCRKHLMFRIHRFFSAGYVKNELETLIEQYGIAHVRFIDDCFTVNRNRILKLCKELESLNLTWVCITRADRIDEVMLKAMKSAGCIETHIGVETGSNRLLKLMNKRETAHHCLHAIKMIKKQGIRAKVYLMYNYLGETPRDREETIRLMEKAKPDKFTLSCFIPIPGSDTYETVISSDERTWFYPNGLAGWRQFKKQIEEAIK